MSFINRLFFLLYTNKMIFRIFAASAWQQIYDLHSRLAFWQWSLAPDHKFVPPSCRIFEKSFCLCILLSSSLFADSMEELKVKLLPAGEVVQGDYFAFGKSVEISGVVEGDVYVMASQVFIDGVVKGDVLVIAGSVDISGEVENNVRLLGAQGAISGNIGHNATLVGGNIQLTSSANIGGNVVGVIGNGDISSSINGDATLIASNLRISSTVNRNLIAFVGRMRLSSKAYIKGMVEYSSNLPAWIDPQATIKGEVIHHPSLVTDIFKGKFLHTILIGSKIAAVLMNFFYTFIIGIIFLRIYPKYIEAALDALRSRPWRALALGAMLVVLLPLACLILLMTILGAPFALTLLALNVIGFYTAKAISILWASNYFLPKMHFKENTLTTFCLGLICYFLLTAIPFFGTFLSLAALLFGLGAGALAQSRRSSLLGKLN